MSKKAFIVNIIVNFLIVALMIVAILMMFFGTPGVLASTRWSAFKYFTIQSNLFAGLSALTSLIYLSVKRGEKYPGWLAIIKLTSTVSVAITFFVVICYLGPIYSYPLLFTNANLFLHGIIPVLAMLSFMMIEPKVKLRFSLNIYSILPVLVYGIIYLINVAVHNDYGNYEGWDWYLFGQFGLGVGFAFLAGLLIVSFGLSVGFYFIHQKTAIKGLHE